MIEQFAKRMGEELRSSWGEPGESGNAIQILIAVDAIIGCCRAFLTWELDVCAADPPTNLKRLNAAFRGITMSIIGDAKRLPDELSRAVEEMRSGARKPRIHLDISDPPQFEIFIGAMAEVKKHPEWISR